MRGCCAPVGGSGHHKARSRHFCSPADRERLSECNLLIDFSLSSRASAKYRSAGQQAKNCLHRPPKTAQFAPPGLTLAAGSSRPSEAFQVQRGQGGDQTGTSRQVGARRGLQHQAAANNEEAREANMWSKLHLSEQESLDGQAARSRRLKRAGGRLDLEQAARSAEMPAEFRDAEQPPAKEQSRLAKLCQQTSSVLTSVLPAPFGGHKRSILCQFFGQLQMPAGVKNEDEKRARPAAKLPLGGLSPLPAHLQYQLVNSMTASEPESIAILHQHQQAPVALVARGRHPIQMVLEHQQRQASVSMQPSKRPMPTPVITNSYQQHQLNSYPATDLRAMPSSEGHLGRQKHQKPAKFSAPLVVTSPVEQQQRPILVSLASSSSPASSSTTSSGWHIFNATFLAPSKREPDQDPGLASSTSAPTMKSVTQQSAGTAKEAASTNSTEPNASSDPFSVDVVAAKNLQSSYQRPKTVVVGAARGNQNGGVKQLRIGKQAAEAGSQRLNLTSTMAASTTTTTTTKRPEQLEGGGGKEVASAGGANDGVRTIEVMAQSASAPSSSYIAIASPIDRLPQQATSGKQTKSPVAPASSFDPRQVQKREELVIASINNLTRIAFGNQLRDTMKVISKLIDQQTDLFNKSATGASVSQIDPMVPSDSIVRHTVVAPQQLVADELSAIKRRKKEQAPAKQSTIGNKVKLAAGGSEPKARHKQIGAVASSITKKPSRTPSDERRTSAKKKAKIAAAESTARTLAGDAGGKSTTTSQPGLRFSQSMATSSGSRARHSGSPLVVQKSVELKRLTSVSRALTLPGDQRRRPTKGLTRSDQRARLEPSLDLERAQFLATNELARETSKASSWFPSSGPALAESLSAGPRKLARRKSPISSPTDGPSSTTPMVSSTGTNSSVVTQFPWLVPEKSALNAEWFSTTGSSPSDSKVASVADQSSTRPLTTSRMATPYVAGFDLTTKEALTTNRVEYQTRPDSLTTLKMALTRSAMSSSISPGVTLATPVTKAPQQQYVAVRSTRLPFSTGVQSRWIPSTMFVTRPPDKPPVTRSISKTTSAKTTIRTMTTTSSTTAPTPTTTTQRIQEQKDKESTLAAMDELRASDSISRYTTHLSGEHNELIATTRRHFHNRMPQIANTGDFFSVETIASWPDKYHTMISQAAVDTSAADQEPGSRTTASLNGLAESTRRNGDSYDLTPESSSALFASSLPPASSYASTLTARQTTTARHKFDENRHENSKGTREMTMLLSNTPGITILPANHKLTPTGALSESGSDITEHLSSFTNPMQATHESDRQQQHLATTELPTIYAFGSTRQVAPYTLLDNQMTRSSISPVGVSNSSFEMDKQLDGSAGGRSNSSSQGELLRPPYLDAYGNEEQAPTEGDPTLLLDSNKNRPNVSRKLYELLIPSTQNFLSLQNSLNTQRFNWSVLKYLAQNLLAGDRFGNETVDPEKLHQRPTSADGMMMLSNDTKLENANKTQQRIYDLMVRNGFPSNYYDIIKLTSDNETSTTTESPDENGSSSNATQTKGLFERAGSLLHDLKQLEQKKAAAILAAFRYQVPGPLVRPWDIGSDYHSELGQGRAQSSSISRFLSDRLDGTGNNLHLFAKERQMLTGQLIGAIKSALFKQKFIAPDELAARLNAGKRSSIDRGSSDQEEPFPLYSSNITDTRRSDSDSQLKEVSSIHDGRAAGSTQNTPEFIRLDGNETASEKHNSSSTAKKLLETLLLEPLGLTNSKGMSDETGSRRDFDAINLSEELKEKEILELRPSVNPSRSKSNISGVDATLQKSTSSKWPTNSTSMEASTMERLKSKTKDRNSASELAGTGNGSTDSFDCTEKAAGFYPDTRSSCRTFYHCSGTSHLLTFECPTQTRFDERSLKCGPWYEVRCDSYRGKRGQ